MDISKTHCLVNVCGKKIKTDSLIVAEKFGKRHDNVIQKIEKLVKNDSISFLNFKATYYKDNRGNDQKKYEMDRDSFAILIMGFTGKRAYEWKASFLKAFNSMEKILLQQQNESWRQARLEGKRGRDELTDAIQKLVNLAKSQGSRNAGRYYEVFTKLIYKKTFGAKTVPDGFRDQLTDGDLKRLQIVEKQVALWIEGMIDDVNDYHVPYIVVKEKLDSLVSLMEMEPVRIAV